MANGTWKIARRGNAQLPLVIVLRLRWSWSCWARRKAGCSIAPAPTSPTGSCPSWTEVHAPLVAFDRWVGSVDELFSVYQENLRLKDENARLRQWRNVAVVMQGRVGRYQSLLHAVPDPGSDSVLAG